jgi:hypothetical protein
MVEDPLSKLLLDVQEVDRASLARALQDYIGIDKKSGKIVLKVNFNKLNARQKVIAYLLGKKVAKLLNKTETELITPMDIIDETSIPKGTVNPKLRELVDARLISQAKDGEYYVEHHQIPGCITELEKGEKKER